MSALEHGVAGALGAQLSMALLYPLDQIRTMQQAANGQVSERTRSYGSLIGTCLDVLEARGIAGLYAGFFATLQTMGVSYFVYFFACDYFRVKWLRWRNRRRSSAPDDLIIAWLAAVLNVLATSPLWVACVRVKVARGVSGSDSLWELWEEMAAVARTSGVGALWNGCASSLLLTGNPAIQFVVYDMLKRRLRSDLTSQDAFLFGAISKAVATVSTYPLQVVQTRMRANDAVARTANETLGSTMASLFREKGIVGWFQGIETKMLQTVLNAAILFVIYERILRALRHSRPRGVAFPVNAVASQF